MINISIQKGRHTINTPWGMKKLLEELIASADLTQGNFEVMLGERIKGTAHTKGIKVVSYNPESNSIYVKAQPGGPDGRHLCTIIFPDMYKRQLKVFYDKITGSNGEELFSEDEVITKDLPTEASQIHASEPIVEEPEATSSPVPYYDFQQILNVEILTLLLDDLFCKFGTSWMKKSEIFSIIRGHKFDCPQNLIIGKLLAWKHLEKDPENPRDRCRLSASALELLRKSEKSTVDIDIFTAQISQLKEMAGAYQAKKQEIDETSSTINNFENDLKKINEDLTKLQLQKDATEENITLLRQKLSDIENSCTPKMCEAASRLESILSLLAEPLP